MQMASACFGVWCSEGCGVDVSLLGCWMRQWLYGGWSGSPLGVGDGVSVAGGLTDRCSEALMRRVGVGFAISGLEVACECVGRMT